MKTNTLYSTSTGIKLELFATRRENYYDVHGRHVNSVVAYLVSTCRRYVQRCEVERLREFAVVEAAA